MRHLKLELNLLAVFSIVGVLLLSGSFALAEQTLLYQGTLRHEEGGLVEDGEYAFTFTLFDTPEAGTEVWAEQVLTAVRGGAVSVMLGQVSPMLLPPGQYWLQISIDGELLEPRAKVGIERAISCTIEGGLAVEGDLSEALTGTVSVTAGTTTVTGSGTLFTSELLPGDAIGIAAEAHTVASIANDTSLELQAAHVGGAAGVTAYRDGDLLQVRDGAGVTKMVLDQSGSAVLQGNLDVGGQIRITGGTPGTGKVLTSDANGLASWEIGIPSGVIVMWSGTLASIPAGWHLCDGTGGTPDLRDRFIYGVSAGQNPGPTGGAASHTLTVAELPSHTHTGSTSTTGAHGHSGSTSTTGAHTHSYTIYSGTDLTGTGAWHEAWVGYSSTSTSGAGDHSHTLSTSSNGNHSHSFTTNATGSGSSFDIRPPYYKLAFIMKL